RALARLLGLTAGAPCPTPPAAVAARLNDEFPWDDRTEQYFTLLYGILDLDNRAFRYITAGHPGPLYVPRDEPAPTLKVPGHAIALGDGQYEEQVLNLRPQDRLYLYSDGLIESMNGDGRAFGDEQMRKVLSERRDISLGHGLDQLIEAVEAWCAPADP